MSQPLSFGGFQWSDTNIDVTTVPDDGEIGYILEVHLEYPDTLHDLHKNLPLCAEHRTPPNSKFPKLMTTLYSKDRCYVIYYRNIKQALQHGLSRAIFSDTLMAIEMKKISHYYHMLEKFLVEQCKLLYTDNDSLVYELQCNDAYEEVIKKDIDRFDTSGYPKDNLWHIPLVNKKIPGLMKNEKNGKLMTDFVGLRSKQYTYKVEGGKM
ncbi:hypothetical protein NQ317_016497 [Molorchus minor]|uniref:DNA-directed DNA polymerase n=1 Tax=Molorchus minor TaxID=1323400 RepID=A0ABQ9JW49_9CUCU|nr:hypothetical protein NQ317_016497 [Molorchus minor]